MKLKCFVCSKMGNYRENNEDSLYINGYYPEINHCDIVKNFQFDDSNNILIGVFDGLGGEEKGEVASYKAAEILSKYQNGCDLNNYFVNANKDIQTINLGDKSKRAGSTAVIIEFSDDNFTIANIGDSRAYCIRNNEITQLSVDHTIIQSMINSGVITKEEAQNNKYKNYLNQCLGMPENEFVLSPNINNIEPMYDKDIFLLCSDGLSGVINDDMLKEYVCQNSGGNIAEFLVDKAYELGSRDNTTAIVIYVEKDNILEKITNLFIKRR